ncbi:MAG: hypothetical protein ACFFG0_03645 [Candidatus Thorarchaeota archaeon]
MKDLREKIKDKIFEIAKEKHSINYGEKYYIVHEDSFLKLTDEIVEIVRHEPDSPLESYRRGIEDGINKVLKAIDFVCPLQKKEIEEIIFHQYYGLTYDDKITIEGGER